MDGFNQWLEIVLSAVGSIIAAFFGVLMRYTHQIQRGVTVEWGRAWIEGPTIFVMGMAGFAAQEYFHFPVSVSYVLASLLGYLGPRAVNMLIDYIERQAKK